MDEISANHKPDYSRIPPEWLAEFEAAAKRPLEQRMKYAFIKTYRPVMDDEKLLGMLTTENLSKFLVLRQMGFQ